MCSFQGLQTSSPSTHLAKEMLFLTPCPQYFVFSLNQSKCPYLCCPSSCLTSLPKSTWVLLLGISVLSHWFHVLFRACALCALTRENPHGSIPRAWTLNARIIFIKVNSGSFSLLPFPLHLPAVSSLRVKVGINGKHIEKRIVSIWRRIDLHFQTGKMELYQFCLLLPT